MIVSLAHLCKLSQVSLGVCDLGRMSFPVEVHIGGTASPGWWLDPVVRIDFFLSALCLHYLQLVPKTE